MGRVAVVTGGTGTIGRRTAELLTADGWTVVAADLVPPTDAVEQPNFVHLDVTSPTSVEAMAERARALGEIGALVVNHAIMKPTSPDAYDEAVVQDVIEVNLKGALRVLHAIAGHMGTPGAIVLVSSVSASIGGIQGSYIYQASKAGLEQLTRHFAVALGERGIRVVCVAPGFMEHPPRGSGAAVRAATSTSKRSRDNPLGRRPTATEVANVIAFLCSERASAVNGVVLPVDCGFLAM